MKKERFYAMSNHHHHGSSMMTGAAAATAPSSKSENNRFHQQSILGGFASFDGDSLPDYSEFDSESVTLDYHKERYGRTSALKADNLLLPLFFFDFFLQCPLNLNVYFD